MNNALVLFVKGFFIGLAKVIPGVSGATLAITMGLYERGINAISEFRSKPKSNILFLLNIGIGIALAMVIGSNLIKYALDNYYFPTMFLFIGLILGGVPALFKMVPKIHKDKLSFFIFITCFLTIIFLATFINTSNTLDTARQPSFFILILLGMVEAATMVIPGISGTGILMMLGFYYFIIETFSSILNTSKIFNNLMIMIPFVIGLVIGVFLIAKLMNYLFKKDKKRTYSAIIGFTLASIVVIFMQVLSKSFTFTDIAIGTLLLTIGFYSAYKLE